LAALHFILANAAKYDVDEASLSAEIQQLGLPAENTATLIQLYGTTKVALRNRFVDESFRLSRLISTKWRVDNVLDSNVNLTPDNSSSNVLLKLSVENNPSKMPFTQSLGEISFEISPEKLDALIYELSSAESLMSNLN